MARIAYAVFGYLAAVLVAVAVAVLGIAVSSALQDSGSESFLAPTDVSVGYLLGLEITLPIALPGFLVTLFAARRVGWIGWLPYAWAGALNAALAWAIFDIVSQGSAPSHIPLFGVPLSLLLPCLLGGFTGGVAYWAVVRNSLRGRVASA